MASAKKPTSPRILELQARRNAILEAAERSSDLDPYLGPLWEIAHQEAAERERMAQEDAEDGAAAA